MRRDSGSALILFSLALVLIGGMGALALDAGLGSVHRVQVQHAADAAVLAAIAELPNDPGAATQIAVQYAALNNLTLDQSEIAIGPTWSTNDTIRVTPRETVNFFFGHIIGIGADPNYSWTDLVNPDGTLKGIDDDNPHILLIPIITEPVPGHSDVTITGSSLLYIEGPPSDWNDGELNGTFINTVIEGQLGPLSSNPLIPWVTQLVE